MFLIVFVASLIYRIGSIDPWVSQINIFFQSRELILYKDSSSENLNSANYTCTASGHNCSHSLGARTRLVPSSVKRKMMAAATTAIV